MPSKGATAHLAVLLYHLLQEVFHDPFDILCQFLVGLPLLLLQLSLLLFQFLGFIGERGEGAGGGAGDVSRGSCRGGDWAIS